MKFSIVLFSILLAVAGCSKKNEPYVTQPIMNQDPTLRELGCHNQPALVKECLDQQQCGRYGEDFMNYNYCIDQCRARVKKSCRPKK